MSTKGPPFYGKFRGVVTDNRDPDGSGRLRARVPDVFGDETSGSATPSVPYAGNGVGLFLLPPVGTLVWIEFEHGEPDYPVWSGCFWASGQTPEKPAGPETKLLKTDTATITVDDSPGAASLTLRTSSGLKITLDSNGISLDDGQGATLSLTGPKVSLNGGALEVQ